MTTQDEGRLSQIVNAPTLADALDAYQAGRDPDKGAGHIPSDEECPSCGCPKRCAEAEVERLRADLKETEEQVTELYDDRQAVIREVERHRRTIARVKMLVDRYELVPQRLLRAALRGPEPTEATSDRPWYWEHLPADDAEAARRSKPTEG